MTQTDIGIGDVALDLAQGRPVHVLDDTEQTADEWSESNNYDLTENYGNVRLGASADDRVFDVVYCSNAKSEPSKTYAMPESRLLRIETEAADDGRVVRERILFDVLETLLRGARFEGEHEYDWLQELASHIDGWDESLVTEAAECADIAVAEHRDTPAIDNDPVDWDDGTEADIEDAVTMDEYVGEDDA